MRTILEVVIAAFWTGVGLLTLIWGCHLALVHDEILRGGFAVFLGTFALAIAVCSIADWTPRRR